MQSLEIESLLPTVPDLSPHPDISPYILIEAKKSALLKKFVSICVA